MAGYPYREPVNTMGSFRLRRGIPEGEAVELFGADKIGGEGEVRFGVFTKLEDLRRAAEAVFNDDTWKVSLHRVKLNQQPGDMRGWR